MSHLTKKPRIETSVFHLKWHEIGRTAYLFSSFPKYSKMSVPGNNFPCSLKLETQVLV